MANKSEIIIPLSKSKLFFLILASILFVILGFWFVIAPPQSNHLIFGNKTILFIVGICAIILFSVFAFFLIQKINDNKPGLVINHEGILDNSSALAIGLIKWTDVVDISVLKISSQKLIMLYVKNPQEYIDRQPNLLKRKTMEMNLKMYHSPLSISATGLKCKFDDLLQQIELHFNKK